MSAAPYPKKLLMLARRYGAALFFDSDAVLCEICVKLMESPLQFSENVVY